MLLLPPTSSHHTTTSILLITLHCSSSTNRRPYSPLSRGSDLARRKPEGALHVGNALVPVDSKIQGVAERACLTLEVLRPGFDGVDERKGNGLHKC